MGATGTEVGSLIVLGNCALLMMFPRDIGTAEPVLGKDLSTPLQLPW